MTYDGDNALTHGRQGALAALEEVASSDKLRERYGIAVDSFEDADYRELVDLAWRYQFDDDRSKFKQDLRRLEEHISDRIFTRLELASE